MLSRRFVLLGALALFGFASAQNGTGVSATGADSRCPAAADETVDLAAVDPRLELRLLDGRRLRLVGLDPALATPGDPGLSEEARKALEVVAPAHKITIRIVSLKPDRWGRLAGFAFVPAGGSGGLAASAMAMGLARYLPEPAAHECRAVFLHAEEKARSARLGLWRDPYYSVLRVDDQAAFAERSATNVVAEGQLREVESGPFRTKLRFVAQAKPYRGRLLVATILPRVMKSFGRDRIDFAGLAGRTLRFRGLLDLRFGPQIELVGPDALEILPDVAPSPAPG